MEGARGASVFTPLTERSTELVLGPRAVAYRWRDDGLALSGDRLMAMTAGIRSTFGNTAITQGKLK